MMRTFLLFIFILHFVLSIYSQDQSKEFYNSISIGHFYREDTRMNIAFEISALKHLIGVGINLPVNSSTHLPGLDIYHQYSLFQTNKINYYTIFRTQINRRQFNKLTSNKGLAWINGLGIGSAYQLRDKLKIFAGFEGGIEQVWVKKMKRYNDLSISINLGVAIKINK